MKKKKTSRRELIKQLDIVFSQYIRLRDSNDMGIAKCITCGKEYHWKDIHAGHFQSRSHMSTRWEEKNVHAQCRVCNILRNGEQYLYAKQIDQLYGEGTADQLFVASRTISKHSTLQLINMIKYYTDKVNEISRGK